MNIEITERISRKSWLAAMGADAEMADKEAEELAKKLDEAERAIFDAARPKAVYRVMARSDIEIRGFSLQKHLEGCDRVIVIALTLGIGIDNALRKAQVTDMAMAVMMDSGASVLTDQLCDSFESHIAEEVDGYMTGRFSPGYGDSPLEMQKKVAVYLDAQRRIGLNVTDTDLLIPRKSVTALIGLADHPVKGRLATCGECVLREKCTLRKEGKFCGDRF